MNSGLYIVTLNNEDPIHVNRQDKRDKGQSITVTKVNCKFGKAKDFNIRMKNYFKTFGEENVNFTPIISTEEIDIAEKMVLKQLKEFRIKSKKGWMTEWLQGTNFDEILAIAVNVLTESSITFEREVP